MNRTVSDDLALVFAALADMGATMTSTGAHYSATPEQDAPALAVEVTPAGLNYLLPGIEPRPRVVADGVTQNALF